MVLSNLSKKKIILLKFLYRLKLLGLNAIPKTKFFSDQTLIERGVSPCSSCVFYIDPPRCEKRVAVVGDCVFDDSPIKICSNEEIDLMKKMLASIDLKLEEIYLTTTIKCNKNEIDYNKCREIFESEFNVNERYYILSFGSLLYALLFGEKKDILQIRNRVHVHGNKQIVFTLKPIDILRAEGNRQKELKKLVWEDLKLFKSLIG